MLPLTGRNASWPRHLLSLIIVGIAHTSQRPDATLTTGKSGPAPGDISTRPKEEEPNPVLVHPLPGEKVGLLQIDLSLATADLSRGSNAIARRHAISARSATLPPPAASSPTRAPSTTS